MELFRALAVLAEAPRPETAAIAQALGLPGVPGASAFTDLFVFQLNPCASVYTGAEGALGGEARDRVAGFWRALQLDPPAEPDHLSALLGLYAELDDRERDARDEPARAAWRHARQSLLWEHLASWLGPYLACVERIAPAPYVSWARLVRMALWSEVEAMTAPTSLPLHLRAAPDLPEVEADAGTWLEALLAPVRSGVVITRADLARAATDLGLGLRAGERRYALRALFEQDAGRMVRWLAREAERAAEAYDVEAVPLRLIARFWAARARRTAQALMTGQTREAFDGR